MNRRFRLSFPIQFLAVAVAIGGFVASVAGGAVLPTSRAIAATTATADTSLNLANPADPIRATSRGYAGTFLGRLDGSDIAIAIVTRPDRETVVYLCDATGISEWFRGRAVKNSVRLESGGIRLVAVLSASGAKGTVTLADGTVKPFAVKGAAKGSGLWRATGAVGDGTAVVGWIVLNGKLSGFGFGGGFGGGFGRPCFPQFGINNCTFGGGFGLGGGGGFGALNGIPGPGADDPAPELLKVKGALALRLSVNGTETTLIGATLTSRSSRLP